MPLNLTQTYHSQAVGTYHSPINIDDKGKSHICASRSEQSKRDNQMIIGYIFDETDSIPSAFQLLFSGEASHHNANFISKTILPKIEALNLTSKRRHYEAANAAHNLLIDIIKAHRGSHLSGKHFEIGFAFTYNDGSSLFCTGFSTDGVKICLKNNETIQSSVQTFINLCRYSHQIPNFEKPAVVFNIPITPGDEIVMCNLDHDRMLKPRGVEETDSLFYNLIAQFKSLQVEQTELSPNDNWLFGRMFAPEGGLNERLRIIRVMSEMKSNLISCLTESKINSPSVHFFTYSKKTIRRLGQYRDLLDDHSEDPLLCLLVFKTMLSDPNVYQWVQYCKKSLENSIATFNKCVDLTYAVNDSRLTKEEIESLNEQIKNAVEAPQSSDFILGISRHSQLY